MNKQELSYQETLILAKGCCDIALENYSFEAYTELLPDQILLLTAARLLRTFEKQGYVET